MTQKTFTKNFSVKVIKRTKDKKFECADHLTIEVTDNRSKETGTYYWDGSGLIIKNSKLDINYLEYLMSRGIGGGQDFVDIVEEYVMNNLI